MRDVDEFRLSRFCLRFCVHFDSVISFILSSENIFLVLFLRSNLNICILLVSGCDQFSFYSHFAGNIWDFVWNLNSWTYCSDHKTERDVFAAFNCLINCWISILSIPGDRNSSAVVDWYKNTVAEHACRRSTKLPSGVA